MAKINNPLVLLFIVGTLAIPVGAIAASSTGEVDNHSVVLADPLPLEQSLNTSAQYYLPNSEFVDFPVQPISYLTENGIVVLAPENTIYAEFSDLASSEILNKIIELVEARDVRWGFASCTPANLSNTFLPFDQYLNISFMEDNSAAMVLVENSELAAALNPWGIFVSNQGRLVMSEELLVGDMLLSVLDGDIGMCWGNSNASELVIYGNIQGLFDSLIAQYTIEY